MHLTRLAPLLVTLLLSLTLRAEEVKLTQKETAAIKSYDLAELQAQATVLSGELVKVKFTHRVPETERLDGEKLKGTILFYDTNITTGAVKSGTMLAVVPQEGRSWFIKVPTTPSRRTLLAYGRVKIVENVAQFEMLGRELKTSLKGTTIVWGQ